MVNVEGVRLDPKKIRAVAEFPRPQTIKRVRSLMELCSFSFVLNYYSKVKAQPLQVLLRKDPKYE